MDFVCVGVLCLVCTYCLGPRSSSFCRPPRYLAEEPISFRRSGYAGNAAQQTVRLALRKSRDMNVTQDSLCSFVLVRFGGTRVAPALAEFPITTLAEECVRSV